MDDEKLTHIVRNCVRSSDIDPQQIEKYARIFVKAHEQSPGGLSIEVGTRAGGSALMWLGLLAEIYKDPPMLFTVDPYGAKPYGVLQTNETRWYAPSPAPIYGDDLYLSAKAALAPFSNHAHFLMRSLDFFDGCAHQPYWRNGVEGQMDNFSFVFLDGDHSCATIKDELVYLLGSDVLMAPNGTVLIDNANYDGDTWKMLKSYNAVRVDEAGQGAVIEYRLLDRIP